MKTNKATEILEALQNDSKNDGDGLGKSELARIIYGNFHKSTAEFHEKKIAQRMGQVCELAAQNGITVYAVKKSMNKDTPEIKSRIVRWRIYKSGVLGMDKELADAIISKAKTASSRTNSFKQMLNIGKNNKVISEEKYLELLESVRPSN